MQKECKLGNQLMKNRTLPLSLIFGAVLTIPSLAMAAPTETTEVDMQETATATTLETEADTSNTDAESVSNQSNPFQISETQTISRAKVNTNLGQQPMTTEIEAPNGQQPMTTEIAAPAEALQDQELQTTEVISEDPVLEAPEELAEEEL